MSNLINDVQNKLTTSFGNNYTFEIQSNFIHVNRTNQSNAATFEDHKKILDFVKSKGFFPVNIGIVKNPKNEELLRFTVGSYSIGEGEKELQRILKGSSIEKSFSKHVFQFYRGVSNTLVNSTKEDESSIIHFNNSKRSISLAAKNLNGDALILGIGSALDIPLEDLALQFDTVTVVDIDLMGVNNTMEKIPLSLRHKIIPIQRDLTGLVSFISENIEKPISASVSLIECLDRTADIIMQALERQDIELSTNKGASKKYNFIVSSMLTSQLFSQIHDYIISFFRKHFHDMEQTPQISAKFNHARMQLLEKIPLAHFDLIYDYSKSDTRIYYSDHPDVDLIEPQFDQKGNFTENTVSTMKALPTELLEKMINDKFQTFKSQVGWSWNTRYPVITKNPNNCVRAGMIMKVEALFLQPKG